jgi:hypothetical protein
MAIYKIININIKMGITTPFAYNPGWPSYSPISGTEQVQNLAVGTSDQDYSTNPGGVTWWNGPDEDLGYVIAYSQPDGLHPTPVATDRLTLNESYKGVDVLLSNGNQTAHQNFGYQQSVLGSTVISGTDKVMFTVLCQLDQPATLPASHFIGIGYTSMNYQGNPYGGYPGNDNQSMGYCSDGTIHYNGGVYAGSLSTWGNGDVIDIALSVSGSDMWVRVNGGNWNNNPSANPATSTGSIETINGPFYPVLCPGFEGTMIIQNVPYQSNVAPSGFKFLGNTTASVGFKRSSARTQASFLTLVNETYNQSFTAGDSAKTWLNNNGYWTSWDGFGTSGFQWMNLSSVSGSSASGSGQNGITVSITHSGGGMSAHSGMFSATTFPPTYGVPRDGLQIRNDNAGTFTATFSQAVVNPLVAFASVGRPTQYVPVQSNAPFTPIWGTSTSYQNVVNVTQYTQFTGNEGFNIIRIDGTVSSISFNYTVSEVYSTICFGFEDQNA